MFRHIIQVELTKVVWYWQRDRHAHRQDRSEIPETDAHKQAQLVLDKSANGIQWKKDSEGYSFGEEYIHMASKPEKRCSVSLTRQFKLKPP